MTTILVWISLALVVCGLVWANFRLEHEVKKANRSEAFIHDRLEAAYAREQEHEYQIQKLTRDNTAATALETSLRNEIDTLNGLVLEGQTRNLELMKQVPVHGEHGQFMAHGGNGATGGDV